MADAFIHCVSGKKSAGEKRALIVAEVGQNHDGSLGLAHAFIDAVAGTGADAVKFQTHIAAAESLPDEPWRVKFSRQDASRYDYWRRMEFSEPQWRELKTHAEEKGLIFLSSPFSDEAVDLLERIGITAWKIASGETNNPLLLDRILATKLPVIVSSGMSYLRELDTVVEKIRTAGVPLALLQCTSAYPCPADKVGLNMIGLFRDRYACAVGLSDHSGTIYPALAATTLGAEVIEVHVTLSEDMFGPDVPSSLTPEALGNLVTGVRAIEGALASPVDKDAQADEAAEMRRLFTKSLVTRAAIPAGTVLTRDHLTARKPGFGISVEHIDTVVGATLIRDYPQNARLLREDIRPKDEQKQDGS